MKLTILVSVLAMIPLLAACTRPSQSASPKNVHLHAGFQVYVNNRIVDFSDLKYMHLNPCELDGSAHPEDEQIEKAHLHDGIGDVVHVHRPHVVWGDLFTNLDYPVSATAAAYINGQSVDSPLTLPIQAYDSLILVEGPVSDLDAKLDQAVTKDRILEIEKLSETCS